MVTECFRGQTEFPESPADVSVQEQARITQAAYRLRLLDRVARSGFDRRRYHSVRGPTLLRHLFPPWQWEAMLCFFEFASRHDNHRLFREQDTKEVTFYWKLYPEGYRLYQYLYHDEAVYIPAPEGDWAEKAPLVWEWRNKGHNRVGEVNNLEFLTWRDRWRRIEYVFLNDERMIEWAKRMGRERFQSMGFTEERLEGILQGNLEISDAS